MPTQYSKQDPETIRAMFNSIAKNYDRANGVLSFQLHRRWNAALINNVLLPSKPPTYLDLCCGTGAIAFGYLEQAQQKTKAYLLDFSEQMLACADAQAASKDLGRHDISYLQADAQQIPLVSNSVSCATIAYGIRNVQNPEKCILEVYRVLQPNGSFGILELTQPNNPLMRLGHNLYLRTILSVLGKLVTSNKEAYRYLCNSIHAFIPTKDIENLMRNAGFKDISVKPLSGGVATLITAKK